MARKINPLKLLRQHLLITVLLAFFIIGVLVVAINSHSRQKAVIIPSSGSAVVQPSQVGSSAPVSNGTSSTDTSPKTATSSSSSASTSGAPSAPSGTFVSTHQPKSSDTEESFCNTSAGATCYIQFTNGGTIKKLEPKVAGTDGSVYWVWQVNNAGLSAGSWQITAVSSLNGQAKSTTDHNLLEVAP